MKFSYTIFLFFILVFIFSSLVSAGFGFDNTQVPRVPEPAVTAGAASVNQSQQNVSNAILWDGNAWDIDRWLLIDGTNANQNLDLGIYNMTMGSINLTSGIGSASMDGRGYITTDDGETAFINEDDTWWIGFGLDGVYDFPTITCWNGTAGGCRFLDNIIGDGNISADWGNFNSINVTNESIYIGGVKISSNKEGLNISENITVPFLFGDGRYLTNLNLSSEGNLIIEGNMTADIYFGTFNGTIMNNTADGGYVGIFESVTSSDWSNISITENQISNLADYWLSNGSSTATGNWDLEGYNLTTSRIDVGNFRLRDNTLINTLGSINFDNENLLTDGTITSTSTVQGEHITSTDDMEMADTLTHTGDAGTHLQFEPDKVTLSAGYLDFITIDEDAGKMELGVGFVSADVFILGEFKNAMDFDWGQDTFFFNSDISSDNPISIVQDFEKFSVGTDKDASIYYDNKNMIINPKEVGDGGVYILGNLNVTENITAEEFHFPGGRMVNLSHNDEIAGSVFGLMLTNPSNQEVPHFWIQSGGSSQASGIARSFMIVNEDISILNSTNRTNCDSWADHFNKTLMIDCNTTTSGADLLVGDDMQIFGTIYTEEYPATQYDILVGGLDSGVIENLSNMMGEDMIFDEVAGAPGFNIVFNVTGLEPEHPKYVVARWGYNGGSAHSGTWDIFDYDNTKWKPIRRFTDDGGDYTSMTMILPNNLVGTYVQNGVMQIRVYHNSSGISSHHLNVDYVGVKY